MTVNINLKSCPFCGATAEILHYEKYLIKCSECDCMIEKWFETELEAIKKWNTRDKKVGK